MQAWKRVWREGLLPSISTPGLQALERGLATDSSELVQKATTSPPPMQVVQDWNVEAADAIAYAAWKGDGCNTVSEAEEAFAVVCWQCDEKLGEPAICRKFLNFWDDEPRNEVFQKLLYEVRLGLTKREHFKEDVPWEVVEDYLEENQVQGEPTKKVYI